MNIYDGKNKMRREINSKMLKKGQQKLSTRLGDGVIVRERMEYKGYHHVNKLRAFCKGRTVNELALTPFGRTLTTRIVRKFYPRNPKHIRNKLRSDRNASKEKRY